MTDIKPQKQCWVIKIGSALLTNNGQDLSHTVLDKWVQQIAELQKKGNSVVLVSSGAVAEGMHRLGLSRRPSTLHELQATAAVGQAGLIQSYEAHFSRHNISIAQILLVHEDLSSRTRYLNARRTIKTLLDFSTIPIVNENDSIATEEICFGDNDTLAGLVANLVDADKLLILTDQKGVYTDDPRKNSAAELITSCDIDDERLDKAARGSGSALGRGGMATKIKSARLAARSGTTTIIANGNETNIISRIAQGEVLGTCLTNTKELIASRKQWLAESLNIAGTLELDDGAAVALKENGVSLLPVGIRAIHGNFKRGELVSCVNLNGKEIARGLINYNQDEAALIAGKTSEKINAILDYAGDEEMIHRDDLVLL